MLNVRTQKGYSFDDVLIAPKYSTVRTRSAVDLSTTLGHVSMDVPFIAANMDSVCGPKMASTMDSVGGFGVIHRNIPVKAGFFPTDGRFGCVAGRTIRSAVAFGVNDDLDDVDSGSDSDGNEDSEVEEYCCNGEKCENTGEFEDLQEAYDNGWYQNDDANYCGDCAEEEIEKLDNEAINKKDVLDAYGVRPPNPTPESDKKNN